MSLGQQHLSIFATYPEYYDPENDSCKLLQNTGNTAHFLMLQQPPNRINTI